VTELLHRRAELDPGQCGDTIQDIGEDGHDSKVHVDERSNVGMTDLDSYNRSTVIGEMDIGSEDSPMNLCDTTRCDWIMIK